MEPLDLFLILSVLTTKTIFTAAGCAGLGQLENGRTFFRYGGIYASFVCNVGFNLLGHTSSTCVRGRWRKPIPVCVAPGCSLPGGIVHGSSRTSFNGAAINFMCNKGYKLSGSSFIYCDGKRWNSPVPTCRVSDMMSTHLEKKSQVTGSLFTSPNPPYNNLSGQQKIIPNNRTWEKFQTIQNDNEFPSKETTKNSKQESQQLKKSLSDFPNNRSIKVSLHVELQQSHSQINFTFLKQNTDLVTKSVTARAIFPSVLQSASTRPLQTTIGLERSSLVTGIQSPNLHLNSTPHRTIVHHTITTNANNLKSNNSVQIHKIVTSSSRMSMFLPVVQTTQAQPFQGKSTIKKLSSVTRNPSPKVDASINSASYMPIDGNFILANKNGRFNYNVKMTEFATLSPKTSKITKLKNAYTQNALNTAPLTITKTAYRVPTELRGFKFNILENVNSQISLEHITSSKPSPLSIVNNSSVMALPDVRIDSVTSGKMPLLASIGKPLSNNFSNKICTNMTGLLETLGTKRSANANVSMLSSSTTESSLINRTSSSVASTGNFAEDQRTSSVRLHGTHNSPVDNLLESNGVATTVEMYTTIQKQLGHSSEKHEFTNKPYVVNKQTKATQSIRLTKKHYTSTYTSTVPLITTQRAALPTTKSMTNAFYGGLNKPVKRKARCTYPPVPVHGTFRFLTIKDPLPSEFRYYIQYSCYPGYTMSQGDEYSFCLEDGMWSGVTPICEEFVPCTSNNGGCSQICKVQGEGHADCSCKDGFMLLDDKRTCRDVNECSDGSQPCEQICTNTFGSYRCSCWPGFTLAEDAKSCA